MADIPEFAVRLREARKARKMTQGRFAEVLGIDLRVYNRWERGAALPHLETAARIAQALQLSVDALMGLDAAPKEAPLIHNPRLHALYLQVDTLSDEDQQVLFVLLDSLLKRSQMTKLLNTPR